MRRSLIHPTGDQYGPIDTLREIQAGHATVIPDRRLRAVARLTPRGMSIRMNGRILGEAAARLAARQASTPTS